MIRNGPTFAPVTNVRGSLRSVRGEISVDWRCSDDALTLKVVVPPNTTATVTLPVNSLDGLTESGAPLTKAEGVSVVDAAATTVLLRSGRYEFAIPQGTKP